jgi:hypothetical protein
MKVYKSKSLAISVADYVITEAYPRTTIGVLSKSMIYLITSEYALDEIGCASQRSVLVNIIDVVTTAHISIVTPKTQPFDAYSCLFDSIYSDW